MTHPINKEELEDFLSAWNGEDEVFCWDGDLYTEDDIHEAEELLAKYKEDGN